MNCKLLVLTASHLNYGFFLLLFVQWANWRSLFIHFLPTTCFLHDLTAGEFFFFWAHVIVLRLIRKCANSIRTTTIDKCSFSANKLRSIRTTCEHNPRGTCLCSKQWWDWRALKIEFISRVFVKKCDCVREPKNIHSAGASWLRH